MKLIVLGAGESGTGAALLAKQQGIDVFVSDSGSIKANYKHLLTTRQIPFEEGSHTMEEIQGADEAIKSPGIPYEAKIIQHLQAYGTPIIDEIEFAARYAKGTIIAVTGSNGKSTTAHLIYHLLHAAGFDVALAGNVGYSFSRCLTGRIYDYYVLELSSFQLEGIKNFRPNIACLLNITPDHLDRYHYAIEPYAKAKLNLLRNMTPLDHFIYPPEDSIITQYLNKEQLLPQLHPISFVGKEPIRLSAERAYGSRICTEHGAHLAAREDLSTSRASKLPAEVAFCRQSIPLIGSHNQYNAIVAVRAATLAGVSTQSIATALPRFRGLPHRLEWCGAPQGVGCYNDSKSTNVASTIVALLSFSAPIIWIAGGVDKGNDYGPLLPIVQERVKAIICLGKEHSAIMQAFHPLGLPMKKTDNLSVAIDWALSIALPGEVLLLSPACASFDLFENFADRGNQFKEQVGVRTMVLK